MKTRVVQLVALLVLASCGSSARTSAQNTDGSSGQANLAPSDPPFTAAPVATFDSPWAMDFLPGLTKALVTEKNGRLWLIDVVGGAL